MKKLSELSVTELMHFAQTRLPVVWDLQLKYEPYRFVWGYDSAGDRWLNVVTGASLDGLLRRGLADVVEKHFGGDLSKLDLVSEEPTTAERMAMAPAFMTLGLSTSLDGPSSFSLWRPFAGAHLPRTGDVVNVDTTHPIVSRVKLVYVTEHDHSGIELEPLFVLSDQVSEYQVDALGSFEWVSSEVEAQARIAAALEVLRRRGWECL